MAEIKERKGLIANICIAIADSCRELGTMVCQKQRPIIKTETEIQINIT